MSLEKFLTEITYFNEAMADIDNIMNGADLTDTSYYPYILERLKTSGTTLTKASFNYFIIPKKYRPGMTSSLYSRALRLRKVNRGFILWLLYSKNLGLTFLSLEGDEIEFVTSEDLSTVYRQLCTTLDITIRLINSTDKEMVKHGHDKIPFLLDITEELMDLISLIGYKELEYRFLQDSFADYIKVVESLDKRAKGRLGIE